MSTALESFQIHLTSSTADKIIDGNNANVEFYLPVIEIPSQYHIYVSVVHAVIPFTFYNVNGDYNRLYYILYDPINLQSVGASSFNIPPGNYNINTLKAVLVANMPGFIISYNSVNNTFTFSRTDNNVFTLSYSSTQCPLLGFNFETLGNGPFSTVTSNRAVNLAPIRCVCVGTNLKTFNINKANVNNMSMLCSIPITTQPYSIITYQNPNNFRVNTYTNLISTIAIKLMDQNGQMLNLNGANWSMTLQFDVVDFVND
jgi:hypothetical protein